MESKYGYYRVGTEIHQSVMTAHLAASKTKQPIYWVYHEEIFNTVDRNLLGKVHLNEHYRLRAQQLRDSYDYLILNYSGGADSHNILMSFLNNHIKLDQVTVRLPFSAINKGIHKPNFHDRTQANRYSEWDFNIKPFLKHLSMSHPEIRIELLDWLDKSVISNLKEDAFTDPRGGYFLGSMLRSQNFAIDSGEREMLDIGKSVGILWGIDKPRIYTSSIESGGKVYMALRDKPMVISSPTKHNPLGNEYFYWSPDMPMLAWEMAHCAFSYLNIRKDLRYIITRDPKESASTSHAKWQKFCDSLNPVMYSYWDPGKFQVGKPGWLGKGDMRPGDVVIETLPEVSPIRDKWRHYWKSYNNLLDKSIPSILENGEFINVPTRWYYLGTFE